MTSQPLSCDSDTAHRPTVERLTGIKRRVRTIRRLQLLCFQMDLRGCWSSTCPVPNPHQRRNQVGPRKVDHCRRVRPAWVVECRHGGWGPGFKGWAWTHRGLDERVDLPQTPDVSRCSRHARCPFCRGACPSSLAGASSLHSPHQGASRPWRQHPGAASGPEDVAGSWQRCERRHRCRNTSRVG